MASYDHITKTYNGQKTKPTEWGVDISPYMHGGDVFRTSGKDDYLRLGKQNYTFDAAGYRDAQMEWMRGNATFSDWTDDDMNRFLDSLSTKHYTANQANAAAMWNNYNIGVRNANQRAEADRADMLAEIEAYKAGFSNEAITAALAAEEQQLDAKIAETMQQAVNQAAAQGRVLDMATWATLKGRLEAQKANVLQQSQMDYENKRNEYMYRAMQMKMDVYKNSGDTLMSPGDVTALIQAMGGK